jgi:hypothetical protein
MRLRTVAPYNIFGSAMSSMYRARPVTLSRPSFRGADTPIVAGPFMANVVIVTENRPILYVFVATACVRRFSALLALPFMALGIRGTNSRITLAGLLRQMRKTDLFPLCALLFGAAVLGSATSANANQGSDSSLPLVHSSMETKLYLPFRGTMLGEGFKKSGVHSSLAWFVEETSGVSVSRSNVYFQSDESAMREFDFEVANELKDGKQILEKSDGTIRNRVVIQFPSKDNCSEPTVIVYVDGLIVRTIYSCSAAIAREFERQMHAPVAARSSSSPAR